MPGAAANVVAAAPVVPIAETFHVPLVEVAAVFTITLWLRLVGAVGLRMGDIEIGSDLRAAGGRQMRPGQC
jgi:hypothetical protein